MTRHYHVVDPATLEVVGTAPQDDERAVDVAVASATSAGRAWREQGKAGRAAVLVKAAEVLRAGSDELGRVLSLEQGKPLAEARMEVIVGAGLLEHYAHLAWEEVERLPRRDGRSVTVQNAPVGVVATITPWNFPLSLLLVKLAPALAAGCTVVAKPSESTPLSTRALVALLDDVLPTGVLQAVTGTGKDVNVALSEHPYVRKISFTGSTAVGTAVAAQALAGVKRVTLELGGNDPAIVLDDADVETSAAGIAASAFRNAGQVCMAVKRVYVPRSLEADLTDALVAVAGRHRLGHGVDPGTTMGPMHNARQRDIVRDLVRQASAAGASVVEAGAVPDGLAGWFMPPTVVSRATSSMPLVATEQFGNALPVVVYDDVATLLDELRRETFGLGASLWTPDLDRADQLAEELEVGTVWVNQHTVVEPDAPFGGWKQSGLGRERGRWGLEEYLETRTVNARAHSAPVAPATKNVAR